MRRKECRAQTTRGICGDGRMQFDEHQVVHVAFGGTRKKRRRGSVEMQTMMMVMMTGGGGGEK